jgi:putative sigma-54 modulation protein
MIKHIAIAGIQVDVSKDLEKYISKKIGKLDRHVKKDIRDSIRADVKLREAMSKKAGKKCTCEVILHMPGVRLTATESTVNMFAAVDIVEAKLQNQLKKHKEKHSYPSDKRKHGRVRQALGKIKRPRFRR